ncbi:uncharacterized protein B0T23DRAFT_431013 [Neurospora hispaniola]|uniref:Uncharacterized protein n=1 Tax=Neurospora hispaniola TaxID=588809 RepID=A0AAJ0I4E8_9PEZI|nr:hypothetical protein B0T23DRAFT_431013 [Neurospora hispaniola]
MHLQIFLQVLLLVALSAPASTIPSSYPSTPTSIDKPNLNPRLSWDDIVNGAKSLYSQAMATPTSTTIEVPSSTSSTSPTAATHEDQGESDEYDNNDDNTQFKGSNGLKNRSNILERRGLLAGAGFGLVVLGLYG